jgi:hypothetical protein
MTSNSDHESSRVSTREKPEKILAPGVYRWLNPHPIGISWYWIPTKRFRRSFRMKQSRGEEIEGDAASVSPNEFISRWGLTLWSSKWHSLPESDHDFYFWHSVFLSLFPFRSAKWHFSSACRSPLELVTSTFHKKEFFYFGHETTRAYLESFRVIGH